MREITPGLLAKIKSATQTDFKVKVKVERPRTPVTDTTQFTVDTIRTGNNLGDIAIDLRRMQKDRDFDRIFEIHIDNSMVKTATVDMPVDPTKVWNDEFELEPGISVSIVFDGEWVRVEDRWVFETEDYPYLFWVDASGNLKVQLWDDEETREVLATEVAQCDSVKGWSSLIYPDDDQGLIVAYVKSDGHLYYRTYAFSSIDDRKVWEIEREITISGVSDLSKVSCFRTNDYRVGFTITTQAGEIYWKITEVNWSGRSIAPEYITGKILAEINLIPITKSTSNNNEYITGSTQIEELAFCPADTPDTVVITTVRIQDSTFLIEFNNTVIDYSNSEHLFCLSSNNGENLYTVIGISSGSNDNEILITIAESVDASLSVDISYSQGKIRAFIDDYCKRYIAGFTVIAEGTPPEGNSFEYLTADIDTDISITKINFLDGFNNDIFTGNFSVTIQLWQADQAPL